MSPKPQTNSSVQGDEISSKCGSSGPTKTFGTTKIIRHPDFSRIEKPFGLEQHVFNGILFFIGHIFAVHAMYITFTWKVPLVRTLLVDLVLSMLGTFGIAIGSHRYWSHRSFKANTPLKVILMILQTNGFIYPIHKWVLEHRIHHKYCDTNADPHNPTRGFYFSHMGWWVSPKHPDYQAKLDTFDVSDVENDPVVRFQSRWYWTLIAIFHFIIPITLMQYVCNIPLLYCLSINIRRYVLMLHGTFFVNSLAHRYGSKPELSRKPYDKNNSSSQSPLASMWTFGEGWHNYHHTFPWDYRASEYGWRINVAAMVIHFFAWIGWATDLKTVSNKMVVERALRTGDGSYPVGKTQDEMKQVEYWSQIEFPHL